MGRQDDEGWGTGGLVSQGARLGTEGQPRRGKSVKSEGSGTGVPNPKCLAENDLTPSLIHFLFAKQSVLAKLVAELESV